MYIYLYIYIYICIYILISINIFIYLFIYSFIHLLIFICSFIHLFIYSFIHFIYIFIYLFIYSFSHLFIPIRSNVSRWGHLFILLEGRHVALTARSALNATWRVVLLQDRATISCRSFRGTKHCGDGQFLEHSRRQTKTFLDPLPRTKNQSMDSPRSDFGMWR